MRDGPLMDGGLTFSCACRGVLQGTGPGLHHVTCPGQAIPGMCRYPARLILSALSQ